VFATNILAPAALLFLYFRVATREFREIGRAYPANSGEDTQDCGTYLQGLWVYRGSLRVRVNKTGLELNLFFFPFVFPIRVYVPWAEVVLRQSAGQILLGFAAAPNYDVRLPESVLSQMQYRLHGKVPFGHVIFAHSSI